jgi:hypothetical protein
LSAYTAGFGRASPRQCSLGQVESHFVGALSNGASLQPSASVGPVLCQPLMADVPKLAAVRGAPGTRDECEADQRQRTQANSHQHREHLLISLSSVSAVQPRFPRHGQPADGHQGRNARLFTSLALSCSTRSASFWLARRSTSRWGASWVSSRVASAVATSARAFSCVEISTSPKSAG